MLEPRQPGPALDASVVARLRGVRGRLRRYVLIEGLARLVGFLLAAGVLQFLLDYGARGLRWSMRATLLVLIVAAACYLVWRHLIAPLRLGCTLAEIANLIERRYPQFASLLVSAVRFSAGEVGPPDANSPALVASVIDRAGSQSVALDFNAVLNPRRAWCLAIAVACLLMVPAAVAVLAPEHTGLWLERSVLLQDVDWPKRTQLIVEIEGEELIGARGDDLVVQAHANGVQPREVDIVFETAGGKRGREAMVTVGREGSYRYRYTFKNAQEDFVFHLEGGDDETAVYQARLLERPRVTETEMRITPPAYAGLDALTFGDGQRIARVLPGSTVALYIKTNKPVVRATLMAANEVVTEAVPERDRHVATLSPSATHTYHFALVDEVGLENRRPVRFSMRVMQDEPPRLRLKLPGVGEMITPEAVLPIELEYADTYGLATAELAYQITHEDVAEGLIDLPGFKPALTTFTTSLDWPVSSTGIAVAPGNTVTLRSQATDFDDVSGPNFTQSPETTQRVVTKEELLAELARREQEYRMEFERLIDSQEDLRRRLLTVLGTFQDGSRADTLMADVAPLERRQRTIAGSINVLRQQFGQVLSELRINRLDTSDERERLGERIIGPLTRLARRDLAASADTLRRWARRGSAEEASLVDPQQVAILSQMQEILASMIEWEGYQEVVNMLRDIIRLQTELRAEIQDAVKEQADDVFDD